MIRNEGKNRQIERFEWMLQMFGVLLLVAVFRILTEEEEEEEQEEEDVGGDDDEFGLKEGSPTKSGGASKGMGQNGLLLRVIKV